MSEDFGLEDCDGEDVSEAELLDELSGDVPQGPDEVDDAPIDDPDLSPLARVLVERDEYLDALRRLQAEFDNYRKRTARQHSELLERATESLLERLLPILDALDLAVAHGTRDDDGEPDGQAAVLVQIGQMLSDLVGREGLERIDETEVEFDPTIHDAVAHVPADDDNANGAHLIDDVLRPGYRLKGHVLRTAMVRVRG